MKTQFFTIMLFSSVLAYSQVGIDTETPKATLDVKGKPSDLTKTDGLISPRLKGSELKAKDALYGTDQKASLVYVSEALAASDTTAKTINVTSTGYFYFDGNIWQKLNDGNTGNAGNDWSLLGNSGTTAGTNFIGTTDAVDFVVKTNNIERERIYKEANINNTIKTISGGDLNITGITVGKGKNNNPDNTVFGVQGLFSNTTGTFNTGMGAYALKSNTTGTSNVAIGHSSLISNTEGGTNVGLGASTLVYNQTGSNNIAIGLSALSNISNTDGNLNIGIGFTAGSQLKNGTSNNIVIGSNQQLANDTNSYQLNIGGAIFGTGLTGSAAAPAGNIGIGTTTPSTRLEVNNGTTNGAIKIVDGTQGEGKVLTSDANGVATWQEKASLKSVALGVYPASNITTMSDGNTAYKYSHSYVDLSPGKWIVSVGMTIYCFEANLTHFQHAYLSNSQTDLVKTDFESARPGGSFIAFAGKISNGPIGGVDQDIQRNANFLTGSSVINVTQPTRIYLILENKPADYWSYSTSAWENYFYATPVN